MSVRGEVDVAVWRMGGCALQGYLCSSPELMLISGGQHKKKLGQKENRQRQDSNLRTRT